MASVRGGDVDWKTVHVVRDGWVDGLILNPEEAAWLQACWSAASASLERSRSRIPARDNSLDCFVGRLISLRQCPALHEHGLHPPPHTVVALELEEGPLFVSYPVGVDATDLREGMRLELQWTDGAD